MRCAYCHVEIVDEPSAYFDGALVFCDSDCWNSYWHSDDDDVGVEDDHPPEADEQEGEA